MSTWQEVIERDIYSIWTNIEENYVLLMFYVSISESEYDLSYHLKEMYNEQIDEIVLRIPNNLKPLVLEVMGNPGQSVFDSIAERLWTDKEADSAVE